MARARKDGLARVHWKNEEKEKLARGAAIALHTGAATSKLQALKIAQMDLPEERRRSLNAISEVPWFEEEYTKALVLVKAAQEKLDKTPEVDKEQVPALAPVTETPAESGLSEELRPILVNWLAGIFREALTLAVREIAGAAPQTISMSPSKVTSVLQGALDGATKKPSVLIAGLKGAQKQIIMAEFGHVVDLRFYEADKSKDQLRSMAEHADASIAFTDFLSHSHSDIMAARSKNYIPAGGGMTALKNTLRNVIAKL